MSIREHRAVQDKVDLAALKDGSVLDEETPPEEMDRRRLSPRQMTALKAFHAGSSLADAAKAADVSRQTLHRWRTQYSEFSEAMECWEEGEMVIARSRMVDMATNAIDALANAIEDGNARAAMMVLKSLRILRTYGPVAAREQLNSRAGEQGAAREQWNSRAGEQEKEEEARKAAAGAGKVAPDQLIPGKTAAAAAQEQAGRLLHNGNGNGKAPENGTPVRETTTSAAGNRHPPLHGNGGRRSCDAAMPGVAAISLVGAKIAWSAQHMNKMSNPSPERPKMAIPVGKAGSAIRNACYSALHDATKGYEMLHAITGDASREGSGANSGM